MIKKHGIIIASIILVIASVLIGINTRRSLVDNTEYDEININTFNVHVDTKIQKWYENDIKQIDDLLDKSILVVKVKLVNDRRIENKTIYTKANVIEVYKGDNELVNSEIGIYEAAFPDERSKMLISYNGYIPMSDEDEYIVFLKPTIPLEGYDSNENKYMFTSDKYGKYKTDDVGYLLNKDNLKYETIKSYNVILNDEKEIENYVNIAEEIYSKW